MALFHCMVRHGSLLGGFPLGTVPGTWYFFMALFHCMVRHGTVRYGSLLGGFPLGTVPGT